MGHHAATVISGEWYTPEEAARELNISLRTLQDWAQHGHLKFKQNVAGARRRQRLYSAVDVERIKKQGAPQREPRERPKEQRGRSTAARTQLQASRALDTVSIVGQLLAAQKAEHDADRERHKWELQDAREIEDKRVALEQQRFDLDRAKWQAEQKRIEEERALIARAQQEAELRTKPFWTLEEAAAVSGLDERTVRILARAGEIVSIGRGKRLRVLRAAVEAFRGGGPAA